MLYTGADERTGAERPPAVPLGELLDVLDRTGSVSGVGPVRDHVLVRHPLQPFDARNFGDGQLGEPGPFSFDRASYAGAEALLGERHVTPQFLTERLADDGVGDTVELEALVAFLEHPAKAFLRRRLGLSSVLDEEEPADALPVELNALEQWGIGERLLQAGLKGVGAGQAERAEWLRGDLPPGPLGTAVVGGLLDQAGSLVTTALNLRTGDPAALDVAIPLDDGTRVLGTVTDLFGDRVVRVTFSKLAAKHRLRAWVWLLALMSAEGSRGWQAATVGRGRQGGVLVSQMSAPDPELARAVLTGLVAVYRAGQCEPLPLAPKTSCAYAERRAQNSSVKVALAKAEWEWRHSFSGRDIGEYDDADHHRVWGAAELKDLTAAPAREGLPFAEEGTLFGQLARVVFDPMFAAERLRAS